MCYKRGMRTTGVLLLFALGLPLAAQQGSVADGKAGPAEGKGLPTVVEKVAGMRRQAGLLPLDWDAKAGKLYLEVPLGPVAGGGAGGGAGGVAGKRRGCGEWRCCGRQCGGGRRCGGRRSCGRQCAGGVWCGGGAGGFGGVPLGAFVAGWGWGQNDLGLDRGQLGPGRIVRF